MREKICLFCVRNYQEKYNRVRKVYERRINRSSRPEALREKALPEIPQNQQENTHAGASLLTESQA